MGSGYRQAAVRARPQDRASGQRAAAQAQPQKTQLPAIPETGVLDLGTMDPKAVVSLQAFAGNAAVAALLSGAGSSTLQRAPAPAAAAAPPAAASSPEQRALLDQLHNDSRAAAHDIKEILTGNTYLGSRNQAQIMTIIRHWAQVPAPPGKTMSGMDWLIAGLHQNTYEVGVVVKQTTSAFDELYRRMSSDNVAEFQQLITNSGRQFKNDKPIELAKFEVTQEDIIRGLKAGGELAAAVATGGGSIIWQIVSWLVGTLPGLWSQIKAVFGLMDAIKAFKSAGIGSRFSPAGLGTLAISAIFGKLQGLPVLGGPEPPKADESAGEASGLTKILMMIVHGITVVKNAYNKVAGKVNGIIKSIDLSATAFLQNAAAVYAGVVKSVEAIGDPASILKSLGDKLKETVGGFFGNIKEHIGATVGDIKTKLELIVSPVTLLALVRDRLVSTVLNFIITHPPSALVQTVFQVIQTASGKDLIELVRDKLKPVGDEIIGKIANSDVVQTAVGPLKEPAHKIADAVGRLTDKGLAIVKQVEEKVGGFLNAEKLREMIHLGPSAAPAPPVEEAASQGGDFLSVVKGGLHFELLAMGIPRLAELTKKGAKWAWGKVKSGAKAAYAGIKGAIFGQKAKFETAGEQHEVWAEKQEAGVQVMVASDPKPISYRLTGYQQALPKLKGKARADAEASLAAVDGLLASIGKPALTPAEATELSKQLASNLSALEGIMAASGVTPLTPKIAYEVDSEGRPVMARGGPLMLMPEGRRQRDNSAQQKVLEPLKKAYLPTDKNESGDLAYEAGHLIANSLGGSGGQENLVPVTRLTNQSWSKTLENYLGEADPGFYAEVRAIYPSSLTEGVPEEHRKDATNKMDEARYEKIFDAMKRLPDSLQYRIWRLDGGAEKKVVDATFDTENRGNMLRAREVAKARDQDTAGGLIQPGGTFTSETLPVNAPPDVMGWGDSIGKARDRLALIERMVREQGKAGAAASLQGDGITTEVANAWVAFYRNEAAKVLPGAPKRQKPTAEARLEIAQRVSEILGG
jgi:hypothetical protein